MIFVHGCFWHRHRCRLGRPTPKTRAAFWRDKLEGNRRRDQRNLRALRRAGWGVLTVWECQIKRDPAAVADRVAVFLER